jgi:hypothetical protein
VHSKIKHTPFSSHGSLGEKQCLFSKAFHGCDLETSSAWLCPECEINMVQGPKKRQAAQPGHSSADGLLVLGREPWSHFMASPKNGRVNLLLACCVTTVLLWHLNGQHFKSSSKFAFKT